MASHPASDVSVERPAAGIALVRYNRPQSRNALDAAEKAKTGETAAN